MKKVIHRRRATAARRIDGRGMVVDFNPMGAGLGKQACFRFGQAVPFRMRDGHIGAGRNGAPDEVRAGFPCARHRETGWQAVRNNVPEPVPVIEFARAMKLGGKKGDEVVAIQSRRIVEGRRAEARI